MSPVEELNPTWQCREKDTGGFEPPRRRQTAWPPIRMCLTHAVGATWACHSVGAPWRGDSVVPNPEPSTGKPEWGMKPVQLRHTYHGRRKREVDQYGLSATIHSSAILRVGVSISRLHLPVCDATTKGCRNQHIRPLCCVMICMIPSPNVSVVETVVS